jgi:hypothetical protein
MELLSARPEDRMRRAVTAIEGLSVGDAFGQCFFQLPGDLTVPTIGTKNQRDADRAAIEDLLGPIPWYWGMAAGSALRTPSRLCSGRPPVS